MLVVAVGEVVLEVVVRWRGYDGAYEVGYLLVLYGLPFECFGEVVGETEVVLVGCYADIDCFVEGWDVDFAGYTGDIFPCSFERIDIFLRRVHHNLRVNKCKTGGWEVPIF